MEYLSDGLVTKKYIDDFLEKCTTEVDIVNDTTPKNINANFHVVTQIGNYGKNYILERSEFNVPWIKVLDNVTKTTGYPTPTGVYVITGTKYKVITWVDTDRDIVIKLQGHSNETLDTKQVTKSDKPQRVVFEFTYNGTNRTNNFKLFFEGNFQGIRFTKFAIERIV